MLEPGTLIAYCRLQTFKQLKYRKQTRTHSETLLIKKSLLGDQGIEELDLKASSHKVETCIEGLNEFTEKLDTTSERISLEDVQDLEQLITADSSLMEKAIDCRSALESFLSLLLNVSRPSHVFRTMTVTDERINQMKTQMQQLGLGQHY